MPINHGYDEDSIVRAIAQALENFYANLIANINSLDIKKVFKQLEQILGLETNIYGLDIKKVIKRKRPYLLRAKPINDVSQIISYILSEYISSSEEAIFDNVFFKPLAPFIAQAPKALAEGDGEFYVKLIRLMDKLPEKYAEEFNKSYQKARNRLLREFLQEYCRPDGEIDWEKILKINSGT